MRFTPRVNNPFLSDINAALPWRVAGPFQPDNPNISITNSVEALVHYLESELQHDQFAHEADRNRLIDEALHGFTWLTSADVSGWYQRIGTHAQASYSALVIHLWDLREFYRPEGCFLMLSHLVRFLHTSFESRQNKLKPLPSLHGVLMQCRNGWCHAFAFCVFDQFGFQPLTLRLAVLTLCRSVPWERMIACFLPSLALAKTRTKNTSSACSLNFAHSVEFLPLIRSLLSLSLEFYTRFTVFL